MRIAVLTLHYGCNHGAILQAETVARLFGGEIVDHRYRTKLRVYDREFRDRPYLKEYIDKSLPLSKYQFIANDLQNQQTWEYIETNYDLLVCGSDELWKLHYGPWSRRALLKGLSLRPIATLVHRTYRQTNPWATPFPNVYWPPQLKLPRVALSASIGQTEWKQIPGHHLRSMARCLEGFELIGVRDLRTMEFLQFLSAKLAERAEITPDPVFSVRTTPDLAQHVRSRMDSHGIRLERNLGFVHLTDRNRNIAAMDEIVRNGFEPVDLYRLPLTPLEWFAAIGLCSCGITDAMHPFIVSLVNNVPCLSLDRRFKSTELRSAFGVNGYADLRDCLRRWPAEIPKQADNYRKRVEQFVRKARSVVADSAK